MEGVLVFDLCVECGWRWDVFVVGCVVSGWIGGFVIVYGGWFRFIVIKLIGCYVLENVRVKIEI